MKKILLTILALLFFALSSPAWATTYYAAATENLDAANGWCDAGGGGACGAGTSGCTHTFGSGGFPANADTADVAGCTVTINTTAMNPGGAIINLTNSGTAGGFTQSTATYHTSYTLGTIINSQPSGTGGSVLTLSGAIAGNFTITHGNVTATSANLANGSGISITYTTTGGVLTLTSSGATITGGGNASAYGINMNAGSTASATISGSPTIKPGTAGSGILVNAGTLNLTAGQVWGSHTANGANGVKSNGGTLNFTGIKFEGSKGSAVSLSGGTVYQIPVANSYTSLPTDSSNTMGTIDTHAAVMTPVYGASPGPGYGSGVYFPAADGKSGDPVLGPYSPAYTCSTVGGASAN